MTHPAKCLDRISEVPSAVRLGLSLLVCFGPLAAAHAATWIVNPTGVGDDFPVIQSAISSPLVQDGDTILLRDGTYTGPGNRDIGFSGKNVVVRSFSLDPQACIIDCQGSAGSPRRGFLFQQGESAAAQIESITIMNGYTTQAGGGIFIDGTASPTIVGCVVLNCTAGTGGGIHCGGSSAPTILNCRILSNTAAGAGGGQGGGIYGAFFATPSINGCLVSSNLASGFPQNELGSGGGIHIFQGNIDYCVVRNNHADDEGGGITAWGGQISATEIYSNTSFGFGGGIRLSGSVGGALMILCTIQGNSGTGGGVYATLATISRCTITGNTALGSQGGGAHSEASTFQRCTFSGNRAIVGGGVTTGNSTFDACIFWDNCATSQADEIYSYLGSSTLDCCCVDTTGIVGTVAYSGSQVLTEPLFCDPLSCTAAPAIGGDYTLYDTSPCLPANNACGALIGALSLGCSTADVAEVLAVGGPGLFVPAVYRAGSEIAWSLPTEDRARITVHDVQGRILAVLADEDHASAGTHRTSWSGRDDRGGRLPRGIYFARLQTSAMSVTRRMLLLTP